MLVRATAPASQGLGESENVRIEASSLSIGGPESAIVSDNSLEVLELLKLSYQGWP